MKETRAKHEAATEAASAIYQIKVTHKGIRPPIWHRVQVPGNITLHRLHLILQEAFGWANYHLYEFRIRGREYGEPDPEWDHEVLSSRRTRLNKAVPAEGIRFTYEYDFGDSWEHQVVVEKAPPAEAGRRYPVCLAGARACPPEDCGGTGGYEDLLRILKNPRHKEHKHMMEWAGGSYDPEEFDLGEVNRQLKSVSRAASYP